MSSRMPHDEFERVCREVFWGTEPIYALAGEARRARAREEALESEVRYHLHVRIRDLMNDCAESSDAALMTALIGALKDELLRAGWRWSEARQDYVP